MWCFRFDSKKAHILQAQYSTSLRLLTLKIFVLLINYKLSSSYNTYIASRYCELITLLYYGTARFLAITETGKVYIHTVNVNVCMCLYNKTSQNSYYINSLGQNG